MSNYFLELSLIHTILIFAYWLILRKERQYGKLRFYLISSTLLSIIIPLLKLPKLFSANPVAVEVTPVMVMPSEALIMSTVDPTPFWNPDTMLLIYFVICGIFIFKLIANIFNLILLEKGSSTEEINGRVVRKNPQIEGSFSFFSWIFVNEEVDKDEQGYKVILKHEEAHAALGHSFDILFIELFKAFFWWLPTSWFLNKEIKKIHEYQADAYALQSYHIDLYSSILISSTLKSNGLSLASSFHDGLIFKRINAMKQTAKNVSPWKLGTLSILCAMLLVVFACSEDKRDLDSINEIDQSSESQRELFTVVEEQPSFEGGMDAFYKYVTGEIRYPSRARTAGVEGNVLVQFVVERDGSISNVKAMSGIGSGCDEEAIRVVKNARGFKPGSQRGRTVRTQMTMPITFKLNPEKTNPDNSIQGNVIIGQVETKNAQFRIETNFENGEWSGTVYSAEGDKLPGVNIVLAGTNYGTVSDLDGTFRIKADESQELHISFVGYESVRIKGSKN